MAPEKNTAAGDTVGCGISGHDYWQDLLHLHKPLASRFTFLIFIGVSFADREFSVRLNSSRNVSFVKRQVGPTWSG
jgi:hypothetical protein